MTKSSKYGNMPAPLPYRAKVKGDSGTYRLLGVDWMNDRVLLDRTCIPEWISIEKVSLEPIEEVAAGSENALDPVMPKGYTVWGGIHARDQVRIIVATKTKKRAIELLGITKSAFDHSFNKTGNQLELEVALGAVEVVFAASSLLGKEFTRKFPSTPASAAPSAS